VVFERISSRFGQRIIDTVQRVEQTAPSFLVTPEQGIFQPLDIVQGKLDAKLENGDSDVAFSIYHDDVDTGEDINIEAGSFIGYIPTGSWCIAYDDGKYWRILSPLGHMGFGQADGAISQDATGTVSVYYFNAGTWTDTTDNLTCRAIDAIASGDRVAWQYDTRGEQFIAGCAAKA
jgi:hypothetical protein